MPRLSIEDLKKIREEAKQSSTLVDRWLHDPSLYRWFDRDIRRTLDYDFQVRSDSPLYPLARLYPQFLRES